MANEPTWKGSKELQEQPTSPKWKFSASGTTVQRVFVGPYQKCLDTRPKIGQTMSDLAGDIFVDDVEVIKGKGKSGTMTVNLATRVPADASSSEPFQPIFEFDWVVIDKRLEQAPIFQEGGSKALNSTDLDKIEEWKSKTKATDRDAAYSACSANAKYFINKLKRGQESYRVFAPVAKKRSKSYTQPNATACGIKQNPQGFPGIPSGYVWVKDSDRVSRTGYRGTWDREESWIGADSVDEDLLRT